MGDAKRRKAEIERLKSLSPEESARWRKSKEDEALIARGVDPTIRRPHQTAALTRLLFAKVEEAKRQKSVDGPVMYIHSKIDASFRDIGPMPIACKKGCSHCCNIWVSASPLEALYVAKIIKARGAEAIERLRQANQVTEQYNFDTRDQHPHPCPLLEQNVCSIYEARPKSCRMAASIDAAICERSHLNLAEENIPTPMVNIQMRSSYGVALACALRKAGLGYIGYEFNAALVRAIDTDNAEEGQLSL